METLLESSAIYKPVGDLLGEAFWKEWRLGNAGDQQRLYHYTTAAGLEGIIRSKALRLTHIDYLNDATEGREATQLFTEAIESVLAASQDSHLTRFVGCLKNVFATATRTDELDTFIGCFSTKRDDLSQWRAYGGGEGGFCISFRAQSLWESKSGKGGRQGYWMLPCKYDKAEVRNLAIDCLLKGAEVSKPFSESHTIESLVQVFMLWVTWYGAAIKNSAFQSESEWRFIYYRLFDPREEVDFLPNSIFKPYVNFSFGESSLLRNAIAEVIIGPHRHPDLAARSVKAFLAKSLEGPVVVCSSSIPFRNLM